MSQPLVVSIPHRLGKEEASRRLRKGFGDVQAQFGSLVNVAQETWNGDHLDFQLAIMGQAASGSLDVAEDHVRVEVRLPWLLQRMAEKAKAVLEKRTQILLEKK